MVAHALDALGLPQGSAIAIDMPMNVDSVIIYLAIVLTGNVVVSIADSFASSEIATRLRIANAKAIFTQVLLSPFEFSNFDILQLGIPLVFRLLLHRMLDERTHFIHTCIY